MNYQLRLAAASDVDELMKLYRFLSPRYRDDRGAVLGAVEDGRTVVHVVESLDEHDRPLVPSRLLGTATVTWRYVPTRGRVAYVDDVVVDPAGRGLGLGKVLMYACEQTARVQHCCAIELTSHASRQAANEMYQRLGYRLRDTNCYIFHLDAPEKP